jgi:hypothetical protein
MKNENNPNLRKNEEMLKAFEKHVTGLYKNSYASVGRWIF